MYSLHLGYARWRNIVDNVIEDRPRCLYIYVILCNRPREYQLSRRNYTSLFLLPSLSWLDLADITHQSDIFQTSLSLSLPFVAVDRETDKRKSKALPLLGDILQSDFDQFNASEVSAASSRARGIALAGGGRRGEWSSASEDPRRDQKSLVSATTDQFRLVWLHLSRNRFDHPWKSSNQVRSDNIPSSTVG